MGKIRKTIIILVDYYVQSVHLGIMRYASEAGWIVDDNSIRLQKLTWDLDVDGIIIISGSRKKDFRQFIAEKGAPAVCVGPKSDIYDFPCIYNDDEEIGKIAAEHLLERGFSHFGFVGSYGTESAVRRRKAFEEKVLKAEKVYYSLHINRLKDELPALPKPIGLMLPADGGAVGLMYKCAQMGLKIPEDVAVVASGNDPLLCGFLPVPLSSVDERFEDKGYKAAELLDRMMNGEHITEDIIIPPGEVAVRQSSNILAVAHKKVQKALIYLLDNFRKPVNFEKLAVDLRITRRNLDEAFKKYLDRTMHEELTSLRIKEAHRLMASGLKMKVIAAQSGFSSVQHMTAVFHRLHNCSARDYRKTHFL